MQLIRMVSLNPPNPQRGSRSAPFVARTRPRCSALAAVKVGSSVSRGRGAQDHGRVGGIRTATVHSGLDVSHPVVAPATTGQAPLRPGGRVCDVPVATASSDHRVKTSHSSRARLVALAQLSSSVGLAFTCARLCCSTWVGQLTRDHNSSGVCDLRRCGSGHRVRPPDTRAASERAVERP